MPGRIRTHIDGRVGTLEIDNQSKRNAIDLAMYRAIPEAVATLVDAAVSVIVVRGAGTDAFGSGSDVGEFARHRLDDPTNAYERAEIDAWHAVARSPVPVIAAIFGPCMGGAVAMALHADLRIAAHDSRYAITPARLGVSYPDPAVARLTSLVGPAAAKRLLMLAEVIDSTEALRIGLIDETVDNGDLEAHVDELARQITELAPLTLAATKAGIDHHAHGHPDNATVEAANRRCAASTDLREGIEAFVEKRPPRFTGR